MYLFSVLTKLHSKIYRKDEVGELVENVNVSMSLLERNCPLWLANITTHILRHIAEKIIENGPMHASWMFPFERMNSYITRRALNRNKIEETIMETIQVFYIL